MAISLLLPNIVDAIAGISVSGVTMKDVDQISTNWKSIPFVFYPLPENPISNFSVEFQTVLRGNTAPQDVSYTLNYRFLGTQIGSMTNFSKEYHNTFTKVVTLVNAIMAVDAPYSGKVEMTVGGVLIGPKPDPAGNIYHGADIALDIMEMQNA